MNLSKPIGDLTIPRFKSFQICKSFAIAWVIAWVSTMCMMRSMRSMRSMGTRPLPLNRNLQLSSFATTSEGVFTEEVQSSCKAINSGETEASPNSIKYIPSSMVGAWGAAIRIDTSMIQANYKKLEKSVRVDITPITHSSAHICTNTYSLTNMLSYSN